MLLLLLLLAPADTSMRTSGTAGITQAQGDARYQRLAANNTITAFDVFALTKGICLGGDTDQCLIDDSTGGFIFNDETGADLWACTTAGACSALLNLTVGLGQTTSACVALDDAQQRICSDGAGGFTIDDEADNTIWSITTAGVVTNTGGIVFSGVTDDITTGTDQDLRINPNGTGSLVLEGDGLMQFVSNNGTATGEIDTGATAQSITIQSTTTTAGICRMTRNANGSIQCGKRNATAADVVVFEVAETISQATAGTALWTVSGGGGVRMVTEQTAACAANVLTLDPTASFITIDGNAANCVVTLQDTTATTIGPGFAVTIVLRNVGGATGVTFPDVANVVNLPTLCSTTGLTTSGSTVRLIFGNETDDIFYGSCTDNI